MGNFDDRVQSIVNAKYEELLETLQDAEDRTGGLLPKLDQLLKALPLIQDIKTEVAACEKKLESLKPEEDDDEDKEKKKPKKPKKPSDPETMDKWQKFLEDLTKDPLLIDGPEVLTLPGPDGSYQDFPNGGIDINPLKLVYYIYKKWENFKDGISDWVEHRLAEGELNTILQGLHITQNSISKVEKYLKKEIKEELDEISQAISECCEQLHQDTSNIQSTVNQIKRTVDDLTPAAQKNQSLGLDTKTKVILSEVQSIRGLL